MPKARILKPKSDYYNGYDSSFIAEIAGSTQIRLVCRGTYVGALFLYPERIKEALSR